MYIVHTTYHAKKNVLKNLHATTFIETVIGTKIMANYTLFLPEAIYLWHLESAFNLIFLVGCWISKTMKAQRLSLHHLIKEPWITFSVTFSESSAAFCPAREVNFQPTLMQEKTKRL